MALDDETGGEGMPLDEGGPEWGSVEEERDYWKGLAQSYAAKLMMVGRVMGVDWRIIEQDGQHYADSQALDFRIDTKLHDKL